MVSKLSTKNPASFIRLGISLFKLHPPTKRKKEFIKFCIFFTLFSGAIPCSQNTNLPPFLSTLLISSRAANGSEMVQRVYVNNAVSIESSSSGIFSAPVSKNVIGKLTSLTTESA